MKKMILILLVGVFFSCGGKNLNENSEFIINESDTTVTYVDKFGQETAITKSPKRVVIAFNSLLGLWYYTGGTSLSKVKGKVNVPSEAKDLVDLGSSRSVSLEAVASLKPDLVILAANIESQRAMAPALRDMGAEVMIIDTSINSFERFKENALLFSKINRTEELYNERVRPLLSRIKDITQKAEKIEIKPRVAVLLATGKSLSLESDIALTGEMVKMLGGRNIFSESDIPAEGETRVDFSMEALTVQNPDIILFATMGSLKSCEKTINKMIDENPVWKEIRAVQKGRVHYLPKEYSVYKPNQLYPEAFFHLAQLLYPGEY